MVSTQRRIPLVKRGAAVALAATLAVGSIPAAAFVQEAVTGSGPVAMAAQTGGYALEKGKIYTVGVAYAGTGSSEDDTATVQGMLSMYFGSEVSVSSAGDGSYSVVLTMIKDSSAIGDITYDGKKISRSGQTYTIPVSSLDGAIEMNIVIGGAMAGMFPNGIDFSLTLDTSSLPTAGEGEDGEADDEKPDSGLEVGTTYAVPIDLGGSMAGSMLGKDAYVTPEDGGTYTVTITVAASDSYCFSGLTVGGVSASKAYGADGKSYVFTAKGVKTIDGAVTLGFTYTPYGMWRTMNHSAEATFEAGSAEANAVVPSTQEGAVKFDLDNTIAAAKKIEQGKKSDEAWGDLQSAIATADKASASPAIPQVGVDGSTSALIEAIQTFNASEDVAETPGGEEDPDADEVETPDGFLMVAGQEYTLPVSFFKVDGSGDESMAAGFMEKESTVVYNEDGTYTVTIAPNEQGAQYLTGFECDGATVKKLEDGSYAISGLKSIAKNIALRAGMPGGSQPMLLQLDTSSLKTVSGEPIVPPDVTEDPDVDNNQGNGSNTGGNNGNNGNGSGNANEQTARFQVGHTYQVPISIMKENSSETSMAAQYFGSTAYVRPLENGTMEVSFTTNRLDYISAVTYQGASVSRSGSTFTLVIPYTESDTVIPLGLSIVPMQELGMGEVTADMHLYLTQATDLGTDVTGAPAAYSTLAQTGDDTPATAVAGLATLAAAGAVIAGAAGYARRREER